MVVLPAGKMKLRGETWRILGEALQKHFLTHLGGALSKASKVETTSFPAPGGQ